MTSFFSLPSTLLGIFIGKLLIKVDKGDLLYLLSNIIFFIFF